MNKEIQEKKRLLLVNSQNQPPEVQAEIDQLKMTNTNEMGVIILKCFYTKMILKTVLIDCKT